MATYLISYLGLPLDLDAAAPAAGLRQGTAIVPTTTDPAILLAEAEAGAILVSPGSPSGLAGQKVTLAARVEMVAANGEPAQRFDVLELDGSVVGLVTATGGTARDGHGSMLEVKAVQRQDRRAFPVPLLLPPGPEHAHTGKPRRTPLAFAPGTRIDTPDGPRRVEDLCPGDLVSTLDNGSQPVRWTGRRNVPPSEMALRDDLRPVRLEAGVLGNARALMVSPRHRVLLNDWRAQVYFGEDQVLVPVQALLNGGTVRQVLPVAGVTYLHLLLDRHEVIVAEGTLSESFHPGQNGLAALDPADRTEIEALFPGQTVDRRRAAFPMLRMAEARALRLPG